MKTMELLVSLDNVKDAYVIGAEDFRQGRQGQNIRQGFRPFPLGDGLVTHMESA